jgi:protein-tyrosine phosphatase
VVTLYSYANPVDWGIEEMRYGFMDRGIEDIDLNRLGDVVVWAYKKWQGGDRVLIRCQAGLNRSGLVTALVLMYKGASANESIRMIRLTRSPDALFNKNYVAWLRKHGARYINLLRNRELGIPIDRHELQDLLEDLPISDLEVR